MIKVTGLYKSYGKHLAVKNVSFQIDDGEIVGFLGPNGAGKSTIMNILTGYLSMTQGSAEVDGYSVLDDPAEIRKRIGYLPEQPPLYMDMTVKEYLSFVYDLKKVKFPKEPHLNEICRLVKLEEVYGRLIRNLSKGYKQRVGIAQALVGNPKVLILDEPTVGLDPKQIIEIRNLITFLGKNHTVILSSHILSEIQAVCERVLIINNGEIVADDTKDNLTNKLSEDKSVIVRVEGAQKEAVKALSAIKDVKSVTPLGKKELRAADYLVEPVGDADIRKDIFLALSSAHMPILSMGSNELSLEQIFLRLTDAATAEETMKKIHHVEDISQDDEEEEATE